MLQYEHRKSSICSLFTFLGMLLLLLCTPLSATAKQIKYQHVPSATKNAFAYSWRVADTTYHLKFDIPASSFRQMPVTQPAFSNDIMQREIEVALLKHAQTIDPKTARIKVTRQATRIEYGVTSSSEKAGKTIMARLKTLSLEARETYLSTHFYTDFTSELGKSSIKHDHAKYAALSSVHLTPVVEAIQAMQQNNKDPREFIQLALSWMQSIPYNTLQSRVSSNGAGYVSPKDLLVQNQGDCDSKAAFLASLLRAYNESVRQKMVLLPKHALLAVAIRAKPGDKTIRHDGIEYVLLEAAGPGYFAIGEAADNTLMGIRNRQFSLEAM
ncbi:hypothetical protein [Glaciecola sp. SC05]|uniref:hypothetical protein n=1 Tax=Glaciecola sp. SC05 TaxID=1987355 RepID=UPI0035278C3B